MDPKKSPLGDVRGMLVYTMRVTAKMTMPEYDAWARQHLSERVPDPRSTDPRRRVGDAIYDWREDPPRVRPGSVHDVSNRDRDLSGGYALLSEHFYYSGDHPVAIPEELQGMVQRAQGHRSTSNTPYLRPFEAWLSGLRLRPNSLHGVPSGWKDHHPAPAQEVVPLGPKPPQRRAAGLRVPASSGRPGPRRC